MSQGQSNNLYGSRQGSPFSPRHIGKASLPLLQIGHKRALLRVSRMIPGTSQGHVALSTGTRERCRQLFRRGQLTERKELEQDGSLWRKCWYRRYHQVLDSLHYRIVLWAWFIIIGSGKRYCCCETEETG